MDQLLNANIQDDNALNIVMQYCKETHQALKIAQFYEQALKKLEENSKMIGTLGYQR